MMRPNFELTFPNLIIEQIQIGEGIKHVWHAHTRAGKTQSLVEICELLIDKGVIPLIITHDTKGNLEDIVVKATKLNLEVKKLNTDKNVNVFTTQILTREKLPYIYVFNCNDSHYNRIFEAIEVSPQSFKTGNLVCQLEDEAHFGISGKRRSNLNKLHKLLNTCLIKTSATLEEDRGAPDIIENMIRVSSDYRYPSEMKLKKISPIESKALRDFGIIPEKVKKDLKCRLELLDQDLVLFNGILHTTPHLKLVKNLKKILPKDDNIAVLLIHKSKIEEINLGTGVSKIMKVKDVQSAIHNLYHHSGYRYIYCVGHKQAEMGQTFADHDGAIGLGMQVLAVSSGGKYEMLWQSISQWIRGGGYTVVGNNQYIYTCEEQWESYVERCNSYYSSIKKRVSSQAIGEEYVTVTEQMPKSGLKPKLPARVSNLELHYNDEKIETDLLTEHVTASELGVPKITLENLEMIKKLLKDRWNEDKMQLFGKDLGRTNIESEASVKNKSHSPVQICSHAARYIVRRPLEKEVYRAHDLVSGQIKVHDFKDKRLEEINYTAHNGYDI